MVVTIKHAWPLLLAFFAAANGCYFLPLMSRESYSVVRVLQPSFQSDSVVLPILAYTEVQYRAESGEVRGKDPAAYVAYYPAPSTTSQAEPSKVRRLSVAALDGATASPSSERLEDAGLQDQEIPGDSNFLHWVTSNAYVANDTLRAWNNPTVVIRQMSLRGSHWTGVRRILHEQEASGQFQCWLPDRLGRRIFAIKKDGTVLRVELADQTVRPAPELSQLYKLAQDASWLQARLQRQNDGESWVQGATFYFTQQGQALVIFPPTGGPSTVAPPVRVGGEEYASGTVGILLRRGREEPEVFPLRRGGVPLARVAEVDDQLRLLYTNLAQGTLRPSELEGGLIRLMVTDRHGHILSRTEVPLRSLDVEHSQSGGEFMQLAAWDAEHGRLWWWMGLPSQSSTRSAPTWRRDIPDHFTLGVWDYRRGKTYKAELVVPDALH